MGDTLKFRIIESRFWVDAWLGIRLRNNVSDIGGFAFIKISAFSPPIIWRLPDNDDNVKGLGARNSFFGLVSL